MINENIKTKLIKLIYYSTVVLYSPFKTYRELSKDPYKLNYNLIVVFTIGIIYGFTAIKGYFNGFRPFYPVLTMAILGPVCTEDEYYFWMGLLNPFINLLILLVFASFA